MEREDFRAWAPQRVDLLAVRGETISFNVEFVESVVELESAAFSCKKDYADSEPVFRKTLSDGISRVDTNMYRVRIAPEDTDIEAGRYVYDLFVGANDDNFAILTGDLLVRDSADERR